MHHDLHEKMRPRTSKKTIEFLGEEEEPLVEYIVSSTKDHVQASKMLELLQSILDDEAEMFIISAQNSINSTTVKSVVTHKKTTSIRKLR